MSDELLAQCVSKKQDADTAIFESESSNYMTAELKSIFNDFSAQLKHEQEANRLLISELCTTIDALKKQSPQNSLDVMDQTQTPIPDSSEPNRTPTYNRISSSSSSIRGAEQPARTQTLISDCPEPNRTPPYNGISSSSSSMRSAEQPARKRSKKNTADVFYRYVTNEDGSHTKLRGRDADHELYETLLRMDYEMSDLDEEETTEGEGGRVKLPKPPNRLSKYDRFSCGYAADGSIRRLPKSLLRYSKERLRNLLNEMFRPQQSALQSNSRRRTVGE